MGDVCGNDHELGLATDQVIRLVARKNNYERVQSLADELNVMLQHYIRAKVIRGALSLVYATVSLLVR